MEKTLATVGRTIDTVAGDIAQTAQNAGSVVVAGASVAGDTAARLGRNVANRTVEHGVLGVIFAPVPCALYGVAVGAIDTIRGR